MVKFLMCLRNCRSETVYDKLRRYWTEKFLTVDNNEAVRALMARSYEQRGRNKTAGSCSNLKLG